MSLFYSVPFELFLNEDITHLVFPSEAETNWSRFCLKHSTCQSWFVPIEKPWKITSPEDRVTKELTVHSG